MRCIQLDDWKVTLDQAQASSEQSRTGAPILPSNIHSHTTYLLGRGATWFWGTRAAAPLAPLRAGPDCSDVLTCLLFNLYSRCSNMLA
uniref:Uncharacterized protein n=1 Tax=Arundo donax TaxID=35708 RepID=A0A0A9C5Z5_ARUDO